MGEELKKNKSVIRDMLGDSITVSEAIDLYHNIKDCDVSKDDFVRYIIGIINRVDN